MKRRNAKSAGDDRQGSAVTFPSTEPWAEAVDGDALLGEIEAVVHRHVILSKDQALACALWAIHTHAIDYADHSPRLHFSSPAPACGKTTLLDTIATMVSKPLMTDNITMAAMFRIIDMHHPTLLIDEADLFIRVKGQDNEEVRGLLNGGHSRGGGIIRVRRGRSRGQAILRMGAGRAREHPRNSGNSREPQHHHPSAEEIAERDD